MDNARIDETILTATGKSWRKIAWVVAHSVEALNLDKDYHFEQVAKRIRTLARKRYLELAGNPYNWRASEVRHRTTAKS